MSAPVRRSPVARQHSALGARVSVEAGWEVVRGYEREADLAGSVAVVDVTPRAKVDVRGLVEPALRSAGDAFVGRVGEDWALVLGRPDAEAGLIAALEGTAGGAAMVTDATHLLCGFALAGPRVGDLFPMATSWDHRSLPAGAATGAPVVGVPAVVASRESSLPLFEVYVGAELGRYAWEELLRLAERLGGGAAGWDALEGIGWR